MNIHFLLVNFFHLLKRDFILCHFKVDSGQYSFLIFSTHFLEDTTKGIIKLNAGPEIARNFFTD